MTKYKIRKDKLINEDNIRYVTYGIDVYENFRKTDIIRDVSLNKKKLKTIISFINKKGKSIDIREVLQYLIEEEKL